MLDEFNQEEDAIESNIDESSEIFFEELQESAIISETVPVSNYTDVLGKIDMKLTFFMCVLVLALVWFLFKWMSRLFNKFF